MTSEVSEKKQRKSFKEYYQNPEFRQKHLEYIKARIQCECGRTISRSNMTAHKKSKRHTKELENGKKQEDREVLKELFDRLITRFD